MRGAGKLLTNFMENCGGAGEKGFLDRFRIGAYDFGVFIEEITPFVRE